MLRWFILLGALLFFVSFNGYSQKIRYKDIYPMLVAQRYGDVEPLLKTFIAAEPDHSNANFQMGLLFLWHTYNKDMLKETDQLLINADSAIFYLQTAASLIDEKEITKNEELYQSYNRRDLKTGKFGVKLEDIHTDIETKIKSVQEHANKANTLKSAFVKGVASYEKAHLSYIDLSKTYVSLNDLYLKADKNTTETFSQMSKSFDSAYLYFQNYYEVLKTIERSAVNSRVGIVSVVNFKEDGASRVNFYDKKLELWDYAAWANATSKVIENQIKPLKLKITTYYDYLTNLYQMVQNDMVTGLSALPDRPQPQLAEEIKKYDPDALPLHLFSFQINELRYTYLLKHSITDSSAIDEHLINSALALKYISSADSSLAALRKKKLDSEISKYSDLVGTNLNGIEGINEYLNAKSANIKQNYVYATKSRDFWNKRSMWAVNNGDSLQLFVGGKPSLSGYQTLAVSIEPDGSRPKYISGTINKNSKEKGFVAEIAPDRSVKWITTIDLDSLVKNSEQIFVNIPETETKNAIASFYIENSKNQIKTILVRTDGTGKIAWMNTLNLSRVPFRVDFNENLSEAIIYLNENNPQEVGSKVGILIIDKEGNVKQQG